MTVSDKALGEVMGGILQRADAELRALTEADLEARWYFRYDPAATLAWNIYQFHDMLGLYSRSCRRWEEMHNGSSCVVERVRDKYMMPKIKEFEQVLRDRLTT